METPVTHLPLATVAAAEFRKRQGRAREVIANRGMSRSQAEQHLRPWLAIACICGADLPELAELLADRRSDVKHFGDRRHGSAGDISPVDLMEAEARWLAADDICPRARWVPVLAAARDDAFDRYLAANTTGNQNAALVNAAATLQRMALHLRYDVNGCHMPPYRGPASNAVATQAAA